MCAASASNTVLTPSATSSVVRIGVSLPIILASGLCVFRGNVISEV